MLQHNLLRSGEQSFDRAIPAVAHPAFKAEFKGGHFRPGAEPDALHATADDNHNSHVHPHQLAGCWTLGRVAAQSVTATARMIGTKASSSNTATINHAAS